MVLRCPAGQMVTARSSNATRSRWRLGGFGSDVVVAAAQILHERVTRGQGPRGAVTLQSAHRPVERPQQTHPGDRHTSDLFVPLRDAIAMTRQFASARLLVVRGYGHTALLNPGTCASTCMTAYFMTGALPPKETVCRQNLPPVRNPRWVTAWRRCQLPSWFLWRARAYRLALTRAAHSQGPGFTLGRDRPGARPGEGGAGMGWMGCSWIQLNVLGHDPQPAPR